MRNLILQEIIEDPSLTRAHLLVINYLQVNKQITKTQGVLAEELGINKYTLNDAISYLVKKKIVKKETPKRGDSRIKRISFIKL